MDTTNCSWVPRTRYDRYMRLACVLASVAVSAATANAAPHARSSQPKRHASSRFETPADADSLPAVRYGAMIADECEAELTNRHISFHTETARGVLAPVRLTGPLHGVTFRTDLNEKQRATTPWEIGDCRLILAMDDFAAILATHDIVEVGHYSMYRTAAKSWPDDKIGAQHNGGLALDAARFIKSDGTDLDRAQRLSRRDRREDVRRRRRPAPDFRQGHRAARDLVRCRVATPVQRGAHAELQSTAPQSLPPRGDGEQEVVSGSLTR